MNNLINLDELKLIEKYKNNEYMGLDKNNENLTKVVIS